MRVTRTPGSSTGSSARTTRCRAHRSKPCARTAARRSSGGPRSPVTEVRASYVLILPGCVGGTLPLELLLGVRVYARWRRLLVAIMRVVIVFGAWDIAA